MNMSLISAGSMDDLSVNECFMLGLADYEGQGQGFSAEYASVFVSTV